MTDINLEKLAAELMDSPRYSDTLKGLRDVDEAAYERGMSVHEETCAEALVEAEKRGRKAGYLLGRRGHEGATVEIEEDFLP